MSTEPENQNESQATEANANQPSESSPDSSANSPEVTVENLQAQLADAEKRVLLAHADLENFRRRNRREMQDQMRYASLTLMTEVLESVDNLQRAIESYEMEPNGDGLVEGVKLVSQQIAACLENHGCKKIDAVGQPFDPNLHQAIQMQPSSEHAANHVAADLRPGFQLHERVIRPSQVFVSTGPDSTKN
ncbi:MAG: nucleotide exchange factor GrpE [Planctomycetaceae bacterium]|nr:nucleotide exchange factor GrpE [Planctomycetaceae bacterium]